MGTLLLDQYSLLHFATGIVAYFFNISFKWWITLHTIFEIVENTNVGIMFINKYLPIWPGGKPFPDSIINRIGDTISTAIGWIIAYLLDKYGTNSGWYPPHLNNI